MSLINDIKQVANGRLSSKIFLDSVSNYGAVLWLGLLSLLTIPIYLRLLGSAEWGAVAACMTVQAALSFLDAGLGQIMPRSIARAEGARSLQARLFETFSVAYLSLGVFGFLLGQLGVGWASRSWFQSTTIRPENLEFLLRLSLLQFVFSLANSANTGFWNGMQLQRRGNLRACAFAVVRHAAALLSVYCFSRTAGAYLVPVVAVAGIEWLSNRAAIRISFMDIAEKEKAVAWANLVEVLKDGSSFFAAIVIGMALSQLDRFILSSTVGLTEYGYYVIVSNLGLAFMGLQTPILKAYFPSIARAESTPGVGRTASLRPLYLAVTLLCVVPAATTALFAPNILSMWLRKPEVASAGTEPLRLILAAVAINAIYNVIYQRILAASAGRVAIGINVVSVLAAAAVIGLMGRSAGIALGGYIWMAIAVSQVILGIAWLRWGRPSACGGTVHC
jgi:O-antigen/teichoic acid export membrane protein